MRLEIRDSVIHQSRVCKRQNTTQVTHLHSFSPRALLRALLLTTKGSRFGGFTIVSWADQRNERLIPGRRTGCRTVMVLANVSQEQGRLKPNNCPWYLENLVTALGQGLRGRKASLTLTPPKWDLGIHGCTDCSPYSCSPLEILYSQDENACV